MEKFLVILVSILLPAHYLGRGLFNIDLVLIVFVFLFTVFKYRINIVSLINDKFILGAFLFYLLGLMINFINPTENYSINLRLLFSIPIILIIINYLFNHSFNKEENFLLFQKILFYSLSIICLIVFLSYIMDVDIIYSIKKWQYVDKYEHFMYHSKQNLIAICIGILLFFNFNNISKMNTIFLVFIYLGTIASHGRTAIITIFIGTVAYIIIDLFQKKKLNFKRLMTISSISLVIIVCFIYMSGEKIYDINQLTSHRYDGWILFVDQILKYNTFFGYGINGSLEIFEKGMLGFKHPHNLYIEAVYSLGVIGFLLFTGLTILVFLKIIRLNNLHSKNIALTTFSSIFVNIQSIGGLWGFASMILTVSILYISMKIVRK